MPGRKTVLREWFEGAGPEEVLGERPAVLVMYNQALFTARLRTLPREVGERQRLLTNLQVRLGRWRAGEVKGGKRPARAGTQKKVQGWLKGWDLYREISHAGTSSVFLPLVSLQNPKPGLGRLSYG
jgi:hypothetical protein